MVICYTICLIFNAFIVQAVLSQNVVTNDSTTTTGTEIQAAFAFSNIVRSSIEQYIREALPPAAKPEGDAILENVKEGLINCESFAKTTLNIEQYKACSSSLLGDGMAALGVLQAKYRPPTSGALRPRLLWF